MSVVLEKTSEITNKKPVAEPAMVAALKRLTEEMAAGHLKSGQALKESVLAKKYGLSRNAIREALNQIVGWGLFEYVPYKGYQIKKFTVEHLLQWDEMREAIEPIAVRRLTKNRPPKALKLLKKYCDDMEEAYKNEDSLALGVADYHFHLCVVEHCGNDCFSQLQTISNLAASFYFGKSILELKHSIHNLSNLRYDFENLNQEDSFKERFFTTVDSHRKMSKAIFSGNAIEAEEIFRIHARHQVEIVSKYIDMITKFKQIDKQNF